MTPVLHLVLQLILPSLAPIDAIQSKNLRRSKQDLSPYFGNNIITSPVVKSFGVTNLNFPYS